MTEADPAVMLGVDKPPMSGDGVRTEGPKPEAQRVDSREGVLGEGKLASSQPARRSGGAL